MTLQDIIAIISTVALVYFCVGTFRIERTLTKVERHLDAIRGIANSVCDEVHR